MTTSASTTQIRDAWEAIAPAFDDVVTSGNVDRGETVLRRLDIEPGTRFLDVAAGSGALSLPAARRGARLTATDIAPTMIERLRARARHEGLASIEAHVVDARALTFPDETFDIAASQHGVTMLPDARVAITEMVRVTKPGGTVLVVAFGALPKAEFLGFFLSAVKATVPGFAGPPMVPPPPPFQFADPTTFRDALTAAGLTGVDVDTITWDMPFDSAEQLWAHVAASNPIGAQIVASLSPEQRGDVLSVLDGTLRERSGGSLGAVLHVEANVGTGVKPEQTRTRPS